MEEQTLKGIKKNTSNIKHSQSVNSLGSSKGGACVKTKLVC